MTRGTRLAGIIGVVALTAALAWLLFIGLPRWTRPAPLPEDPIEARPPEPAPVVATSHIKARLFYLTGDGMRLQPIEQEVEFGATTTAQARRLIEAQLLPPQAPLVSAVPAGTTLKELFITERGEAYVDLSGELSKNHSGGSLDEILTVYTLVSVLTENLPSVTHVQILIYGQEVDTLAGHVELRRPLAGTTEWIDQPKPATPAGN
jgi:germination protein M